MLDPKKVKIGIAPIAWTEDDMPEMGAENSFLQTISEIALMLGFNSIHYFSRAFTQKYNMPPSEYAKTIYKSN